MISENRGVEVGQSLSARCALFEKTGWGKDFAWEEIEEFAAYLMVRRSVEGTVVFREGDAEAYMCFVVEGRVNIVKESSGVKQVSLAVIEAGKIFGEMSLIDHWPRSATAVAGDNTLLLALTKDKFDLLIRENPQLALKVIQKIAGLMSHRLRMTSGILVDYLDV